MARVEELPDDFDETLNINEAPPTNGATSLRDLYEKRLDAPNAISEKTFEELMYDMSKTPLFMNDTDALTAAGRHPNMCLSVHH